jgi:hypothetical protein
VPAGQIVEDVSVANAAPARPSVAHLDIRRVESRVRVTVTEDLRAAKARLAAGTGSRPPCR